MKPTVALVGIVTAILSALAPTPVAAQGQSALEVVERLNEEAMEAYLNMDIDRAGAMLEEALNVAQQGGVGGMPYAQTNLNLGVIYVGGLGDSQTGASYFLMAVCTVPNIQLDPLNSTPDMQQVFSQARSQAQSGGCPVGAGPAPASGSSIAPTAVAPSGVSTSAMDNETPWDDMERAQDAGEFRRFFFQLSFTLGVAYIYPGMKPDRNPPDNLIFDTFTVEDPTMPVPAPEYAFDPTSTLRRNVELAAMQDDPMMGMMDQPVPSPVKFLLRNNTPWLPDGDSVDDAGALAEACPGDDIETGPDLRLVDRNRVDEPGYLRSVALPSSYCVNVASAGFATTMALRTAIGYFVTESVGLGLVGRLQFSAGRGDMANILFGPRVEFMLTDVEATGPSVSLFLGGTMGQIQLESPTGPASYPDPNMPGRQVEVAAPWIVSGMFGAHLGVSTRFRLHPNFGLVFAPEVDVQFPDFLVNLDLPLGVEAAF